MTADVKWSCVVTSVFVFLLIVGSADGQTLSPLAGVLSPPPISTPPSSAPAIARSGSPSPSASENSPLASTPSRGPILSPRAPAPSPAIGPAHSPSPSDSPASDFSPSPTVNVDDGNDGAVSAKNDHEENEGLSAGKKAGIAVGVFAAAAIFVGAWLVSRKRQDNIRRSQYRSSARAEFL